jgi:hypothetical protein
LRQETKANRFSICSSLAITLVDQLINQSVRKKLREEKEEDQEKKKKKDTDSGQRWKGGK